MTTWDLYFKLCLICATTINVVGLDLVSWNTCIVYFLVPKSLERGRRLPYSKLWHSNSIPCICVSVNILYCWIFDVKFWFFFLPTCEFQIKLPLKLKQEYHHWSMRKKDCSMIYWHLKVITMYKISFSILHLQFLHILIFFCHPNTLFIRCFIWSGWNRS